MPSASQVLQAKFRIEALIWLIDIAGYTREPAAATVKTTAQALLDAALLDTPPAPTH